MISLMRHLTDDELLALPASMLTKGERARRRRVKRQVDEEKRKQTKANHIAKPRKRQCQGHNKRGEPCMAAPMKGVKHCRLHLNAAEKAKLGIEKPLAQLGVEGRRIQRKNSLTAPQIIRTTMETAAEAMVVRYFAALGLDFRGLDDEGNPIVIDDGMEKGIRIHGESKDGDIIMTDYPDLMAQIQVMEKLLDRVFGKPKQTNILEGNPNAPIAVRPVRTVERSQDMADLLSRVGAIPRRPSDIEGEAVNIEQPVVADDKNVVPLRPKDD